MRILIIQDMDKPIVETAEKHKVRSNEMARAWNENAIRLISNGEFVKRHRIGEYFIDDPRDDEIEQMRKNFELVKLEQINGFWHAVAEEKSARIYMMDCQMALD